jgi:hypothetical protein
VIERETGKEKRLGRIPRRLLPHKEIQEGREVLVPGRIGDRFLAALKKQQALYLTPERPQTKARVAMEELIERIQEERRAHIERAVNERSTPHISERRADRSPGDASTSSIDRAAIARSWSEDSQGRDPYSDVRLALGRRFELSMRLKFAQAWYNRVAEHGETYRFEVVDQSTSEERKISDLDVHRRAAARAQHFRDRVDRERAYEVDLTRHRDTLDDLRKARKGRLMRLAKISVLSAVR